MPKFFKYISAFLCLLGMFYLGYHRKSMERKFARYFFKQSTNLSLEEKYPVGFKALILALASSYKPWFVLFFTGMYVLLQVFCLYFLFGKNGVRYVLFLLAGCFLVIVLFWIVGSMLGSYSLAYKFGQQVKSFVQSPLPPFLVITYILLQQSPD